MHAGRNKRGTLIQEILTPEEQAKLGIDKEIDGPGDWKPDPNAAQKVREFIENGGNSDLAGDAIQNGGPEGF